DIGNRACLLPMLRLCKTTGSSPSRRAGRLNCALRLWQRVGPVAKCLNIISWTLAGFTLAQLLAGLSCARSLAAMPDELKIAAVGTSLTAQGGWQAPLQKGMTECLGVPVTVTNHARSGETSRWGLLNVDAILADRPDIVLIEFAANDAALNRFISLSQSVDNMRA